MVKLLGSTVREIGILDIVFAPLEAFLGRSTPPLDQLAWVVSLSGFSYPVAHNVVRSRLTIRRRVRFPYC
jgi:hypothetical protein